MQSQSISLHKIYYITLTTFLIFSTRFCYNVGNAIGFWEIEIGGDEGGEKSVNPVAFSLFLLWEITPTLMLLIYFRHIPRTNFSFRESLWMLLWSCWIREQDYLDCPIDSGSESLDLIQSENAYENEDMGHVGNFSVSPHQNNWNHSTDTQPLLDQVENEKINSSFAIGDPSKQSLENLSFNRENNSSSNFLQSKTLMDHNNKSPALVNKKSQGIKNLFQIASNPYRSDTQPTLRVTIPQDLSSLSNRALLANNSSHKNVFLDSKRYDTEDESPSSEKIQLSQPSM